MKDECKFSFAIDDSTIQSVADHFVAIVSVFYNDVMSFCASTKDNSTSEQQTQNNERRQTYE